MNIRITYNWLLEYLDTDATPEDLQKYLSLCGPSIEKISPYVEFNSTSEGQGKDRDYIFDIEITSNRIDMASVMGIAREASAILPQFGKKAVLKKRDWTIPALPANKLTFQMEDQDELTDSEVAVVLDGVVVADSPNFIKERLEASGIRSLNNLIDITNYVMLEIGHPTHIFDYDRIKTGKLLFRKAKSGEKIMTLDKKVHALTEDDIVIDDGTGRIIDLPAVMGTENSVVTNETKRAVYFIDNLRARDVRKTSMTHGIRTLAATYNEKYPDPALSQFALARGLQLFKKYAKVISASKYFELQNVKGTPSVIETSTDFISSRMGVDLEEKKIIEILTNLGFETVATNGKLTITAPTYRATEMRIPEDIVEEVARIYGYHNLPAVVQTTTDVKQPKEIDQLFALTQKVKYFLKHVGYNEVMNYSLVSDELLKKVDIDSQKTLALKNPLSEEIKFLRPTLVPSLLMNIKDNEGKKDELHLFEISKTYKAVTNDLPTETYMMGIVVNTSFADLKGLVERLVSELHLRKVEYKKADVAFFARGVSAELIADGEQVGQLGQLQPEYQDRFGISKSVYVAYFNFEKFISHYHLLSTYIPPIVYATIKLDLTLELPKTKTYEEVREIAFESTSLLQNMELVGRYENNVTLRFYFASREKNITEEDAKRELDLIKKSIV